MRINRSHPLSHGIRFFGVGISGIGMVDLARQYKTSISVDNSSGDISFPMDPEYLVAAPEFSGDATNDRIDLGTVAATGGLLHGTELSIGFRVYCGSSPSDFGRILDRSTGVNGTGGAALWWDNFNGEDRLDLTGNGSAFETRSAIGFFAQNTYVDGMIVRYTTNDHKFFKNGQLNATRFDEAEEVIFAGAATDAAIGNWNHDIDKMWSGRIFQVIQWDRALTDTEAKAWTRPANRFALFEPQRIYIPVGVIAGGDVAVQTKARAWNWTPLAATVSRTVAVEANLAQWDWTTSVASVSGGQVIEANLASWTWTPLAATSKRTVSVNASTAAWAWTSYQADVAFDYNIEASLSQWAWTALKASISVDGSVVVDVPRGGGGGGARRIKPGARRFIVDGIVRKAKNLEDELAQVQALQEAKAVELAATVEPKRKGVIKRQIKVLAKREDRLEGEYEAKIAQLRAIDNDLVAVLSAMI